MFTANSQVSFPTKNFQITCSNNSSQGISRHIYRIYVCVYSALVYAVDSTVLVAIEIIVGMLQSP